MNLRDHVVRARARLAAAGIQPAEAALDAELLAREALGWDRARFLAHETEPASPAFDEAFGELVRRREHREPISVILGRREFWGLDFEVTRDVLTPRPETEIIIEQALARFGTKQPARLVDIGTGTGCLAVCLAREFPDTGVIATDVSPAALAVARRNAARHGVLARIDFRQTSLLAGVDPTVELVVSNPPYVPADYIRGLPPEVRDHEPRQALDGGTDGLGVIRELLREATAVLSPGGQVIMEFGFGQEEAVRDAVASASLDLVAVCDDLQGIPRTVVARKAVAR